MQRHAARLWAYALTALLCLCAALPVQADPRPAAIVTAVPGGAFYQRNGIGPFLPLRLHAPLYSGDVVRTGPDAAAEILYTDSGSSVKIDSNTTTRILAGDPTPHRQTLLQVIIGVIWAHLRPGAEIETPRQTNLAARGTEVLVSVTADGATTLTVVEGDVTFSNPQGTRELLTAQQSIALPGQAPTSPVAVDVSGLIAWTFNVAALPLEFELPPTPPDRAVPPDALAALLRQGQQRRDVGDLPGALDAFGQALSLDDSSTEARVGLALTYLSQDKTALARAALEPARSQPVALAALGLTDLHEGRGTDAEQDLRAALVLDPHLYTANALLALAYLDRNDLPDALTASEQAVSDRPDSAQTQGTRAMVLFFAGQTEAAEAASRRAVQLDPLSPFALLTEGRALLARGQTDAARAAYEKAAAIAPSLWLTHQELGAVYLRLDMPRKADEEYRAALALNPNSADSHTGLGLSLQGRGRYAEAEAEHRQALALDPNNATAHYDLATLLIDRGRLDEARQELERGVRDAPARGVLYARLAEISLYRQDLFGAQEFARRAVSLLPDSAFAHYELGRVYLEQERTIQAEQEFREATTLDPQDAAARYALGLTEDQTALGNDPSQPLGQIASVNQSGPAGVLNIQQLSSAGARERTQAAIQDPTVARVASRSFGDAQIDGLYGDRGVRNNALSYLHESDDRQAAGGITTQTLHSNGVRPNAGMTDENDSALFGYKLKDSLFGLFIQGGYQRQDAGGDVLLLSMQPEASQRIVTTTPNVLLGLNLQQRADQETRFLFQTDQPVQNITDMSGTTRTDGRSFDGELRHDAMLSRNDLLSVGAETGYRDFKANSNFYPIPDPDPTLSFPGLGLLVETNVRTYLAYARDTRTIGTRLTVIGEMGVERVNEHISNVTLFPPGSPPISPTAPTLDTVVGLPKLVVTYLPDARDGVRFLAQKLLGGIPDFSLLSPNDVFLFSFDNVPTLQIGGQGDSYELEYDHTFRDASFLRLGAIQQDLHNIFNAIAEPSPIVRFRSVQARYEGILNPATTFFLDGTVNDAKGAVDYSLLLGPGYGLGPTQTLDLIPDYQIEGGLQFLDRSGWFAQPTLAYQGSRYEPAQTVGSPRDKAGSFSLFNARVGKRWGLRSTVFVQVINAFNQRYTVSGGGNEQLQPGREVSIGAALRF